MQYVIGLEFLITVKDSFSFEIDYDTANNCAGTYLRGGYVHQIKPSVNLSFDSWSKSINSPNEFVCDFGKMDSVGALHLAFK